MCHQNSLGDLALTSVGINVAFPEPIVLPVLVSQHCWAVRWQPPGPRRVGDVADDEIPGGFQLLVHPARGGVVGGERDILREGVDGGAEEEAYKQPGFQHLRFP